MYLQYHVLLLFISMASVYSSSISTRRNSDGLYTCYKCVGSRCDYPHNVTCDGLECFTASEIIAKTRLLLHKGCIEDPFLVLAFCKFKSNVATRVTNCCEGNFCNDDEFPSIPGLWSPSANETKNEQLDAEEIFSSYVHYFPHILPFIVILVLGCICLFLRVYFIRNEDKRPNFLRWLAESSSESSLDVSDPSSDSRSGLNNLSQRCMDQDVTLIKSIGKGRFGEVFQGMFHGENVAVKIFPTTEEESWKNEVNIYANIALYHENVLGFKGSVITSRLDSTELWLLTAFHKQGSLYDYLLEHAITLNEMIEFNRCICSGLLHLHTEIVGFKGKPAIAHRDLKTTNILLTSQGTCVISDFGLALVKNDLASDTNKPINYKVGTKRYMAPEILDDSIKINSFESFKRADIYAFGLILWEVCSRCTADGTAEAYFPPFHDCVASNPDFEDMKKVVCIESKRPEIPSSWSCIKPLSVMANLMKECWHQTPETRATVSRAKKVLDKEHVEMQELQSTARSV